LDRNLETFLHQVDEPVAEHEIDRDVGLPRKIFGQDRHQLQPPECGRRAHAQQSLRAAHEALHRKTARLHFCCDPCTMGVGGVPRLGQAELAGVSEKLLSSTTLAKTSMSNGLCIARTRKFDRIWKQTYSSLPSNQLLRSGR
jgi:hypothetical protein